MGKRKGEEEGKCDCREKESRDGFLQFNKLFTYVLRKKKLRTRLTQIFSFALFQWLEISIAAINTKETVS